ncbi:DUF4810 domain-containing protein [Rheinheimera sp. F8]|uniref:DUF4810 domain-containing protein n=1 Tax=Rheinheimera sp. F8 TaxID=1763998 RepID=UPI0007449466|nr:DUF4810 domain-containing protein [Rheinheimera sp. F8]ALZ75769.1 hypothetical protein ATY27_08320 [Rheinheimera sp. F8]
MDAKMMAPKAVLMVAIAIATLTGCETTKPLYHYGSYQTNVYEHFKNEDSAVTEQIEALEKTIRETNRNKLQVGPGLYAHLGFLYLQSGQRDTGLAYLQKEKQLYPESTHFIDFLLKNAKAGQS